jgi:hypothetical protein
MLSGVTVRITADPKNPLGHSSPSAVIGVNSDAVLSVVCSVGPAGWNHTSLSEQPLLPFRINAAQ